MPGFPYCSCSHCNFVFIVMVVMAYVLPCDLASRMPLLSMVGEDGDFQGHQPVPFIPGCMFILYDLWHFIPVALGGCHNGSLIYGRFFDS